MSIFSHFRLCAVGFHDLCKIFKIKFSVMTSLIGWERFWLKYKNLESIPNGLKCEKKTQIRRYRNIFWL